MKIRIVTPSLNQAPYIERCVRSVMSQRGGGIELDYLVLDAHSSDGTAEILKQLQAEYPRMRLVVERDAGQADALVKGFAYPYTGASAEILGWLNADDVMLPGCLARVARAFRESESEVVYGRAWFIDCNDSITGAYPVAPLDQDYLMTFCFLSQPSTFFRRSAYERAGGIDPTLHYCMDYGLWLRLANSGAGFHFLPQYLSATRLHDASKTATGALAFADEVLTTLERECGAAAPAWQAYRRYRELGILRPALPGAINFASALVETAVRTGEWRGLAVWTARVSRDLLAARIAWARHSPKRLAPISS